MPAPSAGRATDDASDRAQAGLTAELEEAVASIVLGALRGDLALRARAIGRADPASGQPSFLYARGISARVALTAYLSEKKEILFIPVGEQRDDKIADVRIKFEIEPDRESQPLFRADAGLSISFPAFLGLDGPDTALHVTTPSRLGFRVDFDGDEPRIGLLAGAPTPR